MPSTPRERSDARLQVRLSGAQKQRLQRAAAISGCSTGTFVVRAALDATHQVFASDRGIALMPQEQRAFVEALLEPPTPNRRLKRAAKDYLARTGG